MFVINGYFSLGLQCCTYKKGLKYSRDIGTEVVHSGEMLTFGEVNRDGHQMAFDLISDIRKTIDDNGKSVDHCVNIVYSF